MAESIATWLARFGRKKFSGFYQAVRTGNFGGNFGLRTATAIDSTLAVCCDRRRFMLGTGGYLLRDPKGSAPKLLGTFLRFYTGFSGVDGNGGVPDLNLMAGIGHHRSPLTHSSIAGMLAEGALLALVDLAAEIHYRLPHDFDFLWNGITRISRPFVKSASFSLSAGIAWHLLAARNPCCCSSVPIY